LIVPTNKLIFWTASLWLPLAIGVAVSSAILLPGIALIILFLFFVALDARRSAGTLRALQASIPSVIKLSKWADGIVELHVESPDQPLPLLRAGILLPDSIETKENEQPFPILDPEKPHLLQWNITPKKCGNFSIPSLHFKSPSTFGFWNIQQTIPTETQVRVYPNLRDERRDAATLFLNRGDCGSHLWRQIGRGREFEKLREYIPGDSYQDIHWKTTAKRQHPVTKVYQVERTQEIYVLLDSSRLSARLVDVPGRDEPVTLLERFGTVALTLAMAAEAQGDLFGLIEFGEKPHLFLKASRGSSHFNTCKNSLYTLLPEEASPNFSDLVAFVRNRLRKRALLLVLTSLDDAATSEDFKEQIGLLSRQHLVLVNMFPPDGTCPLFSSEPAQKTDDLYQKLGGHISWQKLQELERHLKIKGVQLNLLQKEHLASQLINQYIQVKQRQLI